MSEIDVIWMAIVVYGVGVVVGLLYLNDAGEDLTSSSVSRLLLWPVILLRAVVVEFFGILKRG